VSSAPLRRAARRVLPLVILATAAGCQYLSVGPVYHRPNLEVPEKLPGGQGLEAGRAAGHEGRAANWWDLYDDPDLDALMRQVAVSNQNVRLAAARYEQAVALLGNARSGYFPTITADVSSTRSQNALTVGGGGTATTSASAAGGQRYPHPGPRPAPP